MVLKIVYPVKVKFVQTKRFRALGASIIIAFTIGMLFMWTNTFGFSNRHAVFDASVKFIHNSGNIIIKLSTPIDDRSVYTVEKFGRTIHEIQLSEDYNGNVLSVDIQNRSMFTVNGFGRRTEFEIQEDNENFTLIKVSTQLRANESDGHCVNLRTGHMHWFGGSIRRSQYWPVEKHQYRDDITDFISELSFEEHYWLNSRGGFIYVDDTVPLFDEQNIHGNNLCLKIENKPPYNTHRTFIQLSYYLGAGQDAREAQRMAVKRFLKKPTGLVDRRMIKYPIWSTWRRFYRDINETAIKFYASQIEKYGFKNSHMGIDDGWEVCYGSLTAHPIRFPNMRRLTKHLKARGFRVTLWAHPFINEGCEPWYSEAKQHGYLVKSYNGSTRTQWWNTNKTNETAAFIDFTNPAAAEWYVNRLKKLQIESGIDSFKFDGGEVYLLPEDSKLNADVAKQPLAIVKAYVRAVSQFGPMVEVRTSSATQDLPIFVRIRDRISIWHHIDGGLFSLIPSILNMNINGYGFILPGMIGGQSKIRPPEELFIRWLQVSVFMPSNQYSFPPWEYSAEVLKICKQFTNLHEKYADVIMDALEAAVQRGEPVNPPIWWLDPHDIVAQSINDEFLLGDRILSAPVVSQNKTARDVYLPKGKWYDPNLNETYTGPLWLNNYPAPINVLPYFIRMKSSI